MVVLAVHMGQEAAHLCTPRIIDDDERVTSSTTRECGLRPHEPNPAAIDLRLAPGGLREQPAEVGCGRAVEAAAPHIGQARVGQDDPSGQIVLTMPQLALVLQQIAPYHCVRSDDGSRGNHRPFHHTPPCPGLRIQRGPRVAWGSRHGKSQQPSFYRHVLNQEFGTVQGVIRAKRKPYVPVVLSRAEIAAILPHFLPPYDLVVKLLYGCGLRLSECLNLRVHCFNFDAGVLTIHDGKGQKDRTVPLPATILPELRAQLASLKDLHQRDLERDYAGVFLMNALENKYKHAAKEFIWQWFFPVKQLTYMQKTGEYRRYHLHETHVQKAIKQAVGQASIFKRASAHTFRHSFASHLLQANYDIRTI